MKYFFIETLGKSDPDLVIVDSTPKDMGVSYCELAIGESTTNDYPPNAELHMSTERSGLKLESLLGNTQSFLIVSHAVKKTIQEYCKDVNIEYLPFSLINTKQEVHSTDYFFINPIGSVDCLDKDKSEIAYWRNTSRVFKVWRFILDHTKLVDAPALFRIKQSPEKYVINEKLATAFKECGFTNILLTQVENFSEMRDAYE